MEDRARIKQLLSLTRPAEQRLAYGRGRGGAASENGPQATMVFPRGGPGSSRAASPGRSGGSGGPAAPQPERVLRTVYLPTPQTEAAALRCEALAAQLAEQKRFAAEQVAALREDSAIREREAAAHAAALARTADDLAQKLAAAEETLRCTTRDYILAKQQRDAAEGAAAAARGEAEALRRQGRQALEAARAEGAAALQVQRAEAEADSRASTQVRACTCACMDLAIQGGGLACWLPPCPGTTPSLIPAPPALSGPQALAAELALREEGLLKFETLHKLIRGQLEARAEEAERRAARLAAHNRQLQARRAREMEGWAADVGQLRKRLAAVERQLRQQALLQRLPDSDALDAALARHARWAALSGLRPGLRADQTCSKSQQFAVLPSLPRRRLASQEDEPDFAGGDAAEELAGIRGALRELAERAWRHQAPAGGSSELGGGSGSSVDDEYDG